MANITKRYNGKFQVRIRRLGLPTLVRTFDRKADAERWARDAESSHDRGVWKDRRLAESTTMDHLLERYADEVVPLKRGSAVELLRVGTLRRDEISKFSLARLTSVVLADWRDRRLQAGAAGSTINRELNLISAVCNWARKELRIPFDNPVADTRRPDNGKARERRLKGDEEERLYKAIEPGPRESAGKKRTGNYHHGSRNKHLKPIIQLALETAMRQGELLGLRWENINLEDQTAHLPDTKNGESRTVPLSLKAVAVLRELNSDETEQGHVFPMTQDAVKRAWKRACQRAKIEDLHFHDLRHEATSRLAEKLPNLIELSAVTGHKDLRMLKRYYHPRATDLAKKLG